MKIISENENPYQFHRTERIHRPKKSSLSFPFGGGGSNPTSLPFIHHNFFLFTLSFPIRNRI